MGPRPDLAPAGRKIGARGRGKDITLDQVELAELNRPKSAWEAEMRGREAGRAAAGGGRISACDSTESRGSGDPSPATLPPGGGGKELFQRGPGRQTPDSV